MGRGLLLFSFHLTAAHLATNATGKPGLLPVPPVRLALLMEGGRPPTSNLPATFRVHAGESLFAFCGRRRCHHPIPFLTGSILTIPSFSHGREILFDAHALRDACWLSWLLGIRIDHRWGI